MTFRQPTPKFSWGTIEGGKATGLFADIVARRTDFAIGDIFGDAYRIRVSTFTAMINPKSFLVILSPLPTAVQ